MNGKLSKDENMSERLVEKSKHNEVLYEIKQLPLYNISDVPKVQQNFDSLTTSKDQLNFLLGIVAKGIITNEKRLAAVAMHLLRTNLQIQDETIARLLCGEEVGEFKEKPWYRPTDFLNLSTKKPTS